MSTRLNANLGPAMMGLPSDRHRAFVVALSEQPVVNYTAAAKTAGFGSTDGSSAVIGHRLAHDERIQAAIAEEGIRRMKGMVPVALGALRLMLENTTLQTKDRLAVIKTVLDRGGVPAVTEHNVKTERVPTEEEKIAEVIAIANALGLDPKVLLGRAVVPALPAPAIDAEYEVVNEKVDEENWG